MTKEENSTLVKGVFIKEFVSKKGTSIFNVAFNTIEFMNFLKENHNKDKNGKLWTNIKFVPNKKVSDTGLSHTALLDTYYFANAEEAAEEIASEFLEENDEQIHEKEEALIEAEIEEEEDNLINV